MQGEWAVGSGQWAVGSLAPGCARPTSPAHRPLPPAPCPLPRGITLIELLITIVIISIISAAVLGTASAAMEAGRRSRTRATVAKIHELLMERWDSYATRRVDVNPQITIALDAWIAAAANPADLAQRNIQRGQIMADARLCALRELMKMEMPDRWSDITGAPLSANPSLNQPIVLAAPPPPASAPALTQTYYRRLRTLQTAGADVDSLLLNQGAECLYLTIMFATGDGEARTLFAAQDIGDTDGDGAFEFLDGWGNPIQYIRWPAGFVTASPLMTGDAEGDHDPFDVFRRDAPPPPPPAMLPPLESYPTAGQRRTTFRNLVANMRTRTLKAFRLVPLVYSGGSDEDPDLHQAKDALVDDPYMPYSSSGADEDAVSALLGTPLGRDVEQTYDGDNWRDNIHNHLQEY